jgi:hypothetical protein
MGWAQVNMQNIIIDSLNNKLTPLKYRTTKKANK